MWMPQRRKKDPECSEQEKQHLRRRGQHVSPDNFHKKRELLHGFDKKVEVEEHLLEKQHSEASKKMASKEKIEPSYNSSAHEEQQHIKRAERTIYLARWKRLLDSFWNWTGLSEIKLTNFLLPVAIALTPIIFNSLAKSREEKLAIQKDRQNALESYIDKIPDLLNNSEKNRVIMQARTQSTLKLLEGDLPRQAVIIDFLRNAGLLGDPQIKTVESKKESVFKNLNSRGINLTELELYRVDFTETNFSKANLTKVLMNKANLQGANLSEATLIRADLNQANLRGAFLIGTKLGNANLSKANLIGASFEDAVLNNTNFKGSFYYDDGDDTNNNKNNKNNKDTNFPKEFNPSSQNLIKLGPGVKISSSAKIDDLFQKANLSEINLSDMTFNGTNLKNTNFKGATLTSAKFVDANLTGAILSDAKLKGADFTDAILNDTKFIGADLKSADFTGAELTRTEFKGAKNLDLDNLKKAQTICDIIMPNGKKYDDNCPSKKQSKN